MKPNLALRITIRSPPRLFERKHSVNNSRTFWQQSDSPNVNCHLSDNLTSISAGSGWQVGRRKFCLAALKISED